jgi:hypothetical protein
MAMDATKGMSNEQIMKQIIKDATKGLKGEEKEKAIRDLFVKVMPKPKAISGKKKTAIKKMAANKGGMSMKKKTKYMAKGGMKKTKYMAKGGMKKTKYMARGGAARRR